MFDTIALVNLILSVLILVLGVWAYVKTKSRVELYVGIAFGLFSISHLVTLLGLRTDLTFPLIIIRSLAYLTVLYAMYIALAKKKKKD
jgi:uncharacterized membrane protein (UPF0136 family)